jgi:hypothetical protein
MTVMYGDSNVGKTFVALDLAYHIAAGKPYAGLKVTQGVVAYVAAEGGRGARLRVRALGAKHGVVGDDFQFLLSPVDLRNPDADVAPLIAALLDLPRRPSIVFVDTVSRAMAGGDENSSVDMGALVKHFDLVRAATGAHLLAVHHTGKDAAKGARGHSLLRAATDTEIEVAEGRISVTKQRDLEKSWSADFELDVVTLGVDVDGDPVTSCTVRLLDAGEAKVKDATPSEGERRVLDALRRIEDEAYPAKTGGVSCADLSARLSASGGIVAPDTVRCTLHRLSEKGFVSTAARGRWVFVRKQEPDLSVFD